MKHDLYPVLLETSEEKEIPQLCPICSSTVKQQRIGQATGWSCALGGYAHYYQAKYDYLKQWFTSGQGNLREPVINAMNCVQGDAA